MSNEFILHILDLLGTVGNVTARRMFGGYGIYLDNLMFAIVVDDILYLKADSQIQARFQDLGRSSFSYQRQGKNISMSYYQAPDEALENPEEMKAWAALACQAALRNSRQINKK